MAIPQTFVPPQSNNPPPQLYSPPSQPAYAPVPPPVVPQINMSPAPVSYQPPAVSAPLTTAPATYAPVPAGQRGAPKSASDPRVKDAIEFAEFAIAAMKVRYIIEIYWLSYCSYLEINLDCSITNWLSQKTGYKRLFGDWNSVDFLQ
jgi:hypothetical protein